MFEKIAFTLTCFSIVLGQMVGRTMAKRIFVATGEQYSSLWRRKCLQKKYRSIFGTDANYSAFILANFLTILGILAWVIAIGTDGLRL